MEHECFIAGALVSPAYLTKCLVSWNEGTRWIMALLSLASPLLEPIREDANVDFLDSPVSMTPYWADSNADASHYQLEDNLHHAFRTAGYAPLRHIGITGYDGCVELRGRVPTYFLNQLAQSLAASFPGVQRVVNYIEVVCPR